MTEQGTVTFIKYQTEEEVVGSVEIYFSLRRFEKRRISSFVHLLNVLINVL